VNLGNYLALGIVLVRAARGASSPWVLEQPLYSTDDQSIGGQNRAGDRDRCRQSGREWRPGVRPRRRGPCFGCDIDAARASATVAARALGPVLRWEAIHPIDLTKPPDVQRYVDQAIERHGRIDVLVNAGAHQSPVRTDFRNELRTAVGTHDGGRSGPRFSDVQGGLAAPDGRAAADRSSISRSVAALRGAEFAGNAGRTAPGRAPCLAMTRQLAV